MFSKKITAFTLAEVLLTLTIIGVIAALTIPALKESSDRSANLSLLQKAFSTSANAFAQLQAENGPPLYWKLQDGSRVFVDGKSENVSKFFKQKMNVAAETNIIPSDYKIKSLKGTAADSFKIDDTTVKIKGNTDSFQTADGMLWFPSNTYSGCKYSKSVTGSSSKTTVYLCGLLVVDTNGPKKPNRMGLDVFVLDITSDGVQPHNSSTDDCANLNGAGYTCAVKALSGDERALNFIYD